MADFTGAKIYGNNGELIRDYVPCIRMSDYKVGIYDKCGSVSTSSNSPLYVNINDEVEDFWYWDESWGRPYEVRYHADEQVTLNNSTNVIDHTFENGVGTLTFDRPVTSVPQLFTNTAIKTAEFPHSVAEISNYCFQDCTSLTGITIPPRVTVIGVSEFMRCTNLSSVNFANNSTITQLWNYCFSNCSVLGHISLPDTITSIGASAFENCKKLTIDSLPKNLKTINAKAFRYDSNINFSDMPSGVTTIGTNAFEGCSNLELSSLPDTLSSIGDTAFQNCKKIKLSGLPDGITSVPSYVFRYAGLNHEFKLPNACTYIGIQAFTQSNVQITKLPDTITTINTQAFELCTLSRWDNGTINMPAQLKTLNSRAFRRNNLLRIVKFKSQPDSMAADTFAEDTGITDIYCPWYEGDLSGAPWGATNATIHYNYVPEEEPEEEIPIEDIVIDNKTIVYKAPVKATSIVAENVASHEFENGVGTIIFNNPITGIPSGFASETSITEIKLPENVTSIGSNAFYNCLNLTKAIMPDNLTTIDQQAFAFCRNLELSSLPSKLSAIEYAGFGGCSSIILTSLPSGITTIHSNSFAGCTNLALTSLPPNLTTIEMDGFIGCYNLIINSLPSTLLEIREQAFYGCINMILNTIPSSVVNISNAVFQGCFKITTITFEGVPSSINSMAFYNCSNLTNIYCPWYEGDIPGAPWGALKATIHYLEIEDIPIEDIVIDNKTIVYKAPVKVTEITAANITSHNFEDNIGTIVFNDTLTSIPSGFAQNTNITEIKLPEDVTTIEKYAFYNCSSLIKVIMPDELSKIDNMAFSSCNNLELDSLPTNLSSLGYAFEGCKKIALTSLPSKLTSIEAGTFINCTNLALTSLPSGLIKIGEEAFNSCRNLALSSLPDTLTTLDTNAFYHCTNLAISSLPESLTYLGSQAFYHCDNVSFNHIPASVKTIGFAIVYYPNKIKTIIFDGTPSSISDAFYYTNILSDIYCPWSKLEVANAPWGAIHSTIHYNYKPVDLIEINDKTVAYAANQKLNYYNSNISSYISSHQFDGKTGIITFNSNISSLTSVNPLESIFKGNNTDETSLTRIKVPENITIIDNYAFYDDELIDKINIPDAATYIGDYAYAHCYNIHNDTLPSGIEYIGDHAFEFDQVKFTQFPSSLNHIGDYAFNYCSDLEYLTFYSTPSSISNTAFNDCNNLTLIQVPWISGEVAGAPWGAENAEIIYGFDPNTLKISYAANNKIEFNNDQDPLISNIINHTYSNGSGEIILNKSVNYINSSLFKDHSGDFITSIYLPDGITSIHSMAFMGNNLQQIRFPNDLEDIGQYAFYNAFDNVSTINIKLPNTLSSISNGAFANCDHISLSSLPDDLTYIGMSGFYKCLGLHNITFNSKPESIASYAFKECNNLMIINVPWTSGEVYNSTSAPWILKNALINYGVENYVKINEIKYYATSKLTLYDDTDVAYHNWSNNIGIVGFNHELSSVGETFRGITTIQDIIFGSIVNIGDHAFDGCTTLSPGSQFGISGTNFYQAIRQIGEYAFNGCTRLASNHTILNIPSTVTYIDDYAFNNVTSISSVFFEGTPEYIGVNAFAGTSITSATNRRLRVPWASTDTVNANYPWGLSSPPMSYNCRRVYPGTHENSGYYINGTTGKLVAETGNYYTDAIPAEYGESIELIVTNKKYSSKKTKRVHGYKDTFISTSSNSSWVKEIGNIVFNGNTGPTTSSIVKAIDNSNIKYVRLGHDVNESFCVLYIFKN